MAARLAELLGVGADCGDPCAGLPAVAPAGVPHVFVLHGEEIQPCHRQDGAHRCEHPVLMDADTPKKWVWGRRGGGGGGVALTALRLLSCHSQRVGEAVIGRFSACGTGQGSTCPPRRAWELALRPLMSPWWQPSVKSRTVELRHWYLWALRQCRSQKTYGCDVAKASQREAGQLTKHPLNLPDVETSEQSVNMSCWRVSSCR